MKKQFLLVGFFAILAPPFIFCGAKRERLISNSQGYKIERPDTSLKYPPGWTKPGWKEGERENEYYYVVGRSKPSHKQITDKGSWSQEDAARYAFVDAQEQIGHYIGTKITSEQKNITDVTQKEELKRQEEFFATIWVESAGSFEGVEPMDYYYEIYTMTHNKKQIEYVYYWSKYRISEAAIEKARDNIEKLQNAEERDKQRLKDIYARFKEIIAELDEYKPDDIRYAPLYNKLILIDAMISLLEYYKTNPRADNYENISKEIAESVPLYSPANRLQKQIADLTAEKKERDGKIEKLEQEKKILEREAKTIEDVIKAIESRFSNATGEQAGFGGMQNELKDLQNIELGNAANIQQILNAIRINKNNVAIASIIALKARQIMVSGKAVSVIIITNHDYYMLLPGNLSYVGSSNGWFDRPATVTKYDEVIAWCNRLNQSIGYSQHRGYRLAAFRELHAVVQAGIVPEEYLHRYTWITHDNTLSALKEDTVVYYKGTPLQRVTRKPDTISFMVVLDTEP